MHNFPAHKKISIQFFFILFLIIAIGISLFSLSYANAGNDVVINEIAWMGTQTSASNEWIELYNTSSQQVDLSGWVLNASDGSPQIQLSGVIAAKSYFLLERQDDNTIPQIPADQIYNGTLTNNGESLQLIDNNGNVIDQVDRWYAGNSTSRATMERTYVSLAGNQAINWTTSTASYVGGLGTPKAINSIYTAVSAGEQFNSVSDAPGAINVYFNKSAYTQYGAKTNNRANYHVNLENRLLKRIKEATVSIDLATYEINLERIVEALINKAALGVKIRVIADAKTPDPDDQDHTKRYEIMRLLIEKMVRGKDGNVGTSDDIAVFSDSPMFAVTDSAERAEYNLSGSLDDFPQRTIRVGTKEFTGSIISFGEAKLNGGYYSPSQQMHNNFAIVDDKWVFTGSWNFTVTGLYGSESNMQQGILGGNQQHVVEIHSPALASIYTTEFNEMWGSDTMTPSLINSNFHARKADNTGHIVNVGGKPVEIYFSPGDDAIGKALEIISFEADHRAFFTIFAWSDQGMADELKLKWEGSKQDLTGTRTGFEVKGVFDSWFWNQCWSASIDMTGITLTDACGNNPNTRWNNPAPVFKDAESRKLHSKTIIIDADTASEPTVIVGSTDFSNNGNNINDENMLIIHDARVANQFLQEFNARYKAAGGEIYPQ